MENSTNHQNHTQKKRRKPGPTSVVATFFKVFFTLCLVGVLSLGIFAWIFMSYVKTTLAPDLRINLSDFTMKLSSVIMYEDGNGNWKELEKLYGTENRSWVSFEDIPEYAYQAAIAIEDERFYTHNGVDWKRTAGAVVNMFFGMRDTFGGSTITQQLIKNLTEEDSVTVKRKVTEIFQALELENNYSKEDILEVYLNKIFFGQNAYGIGAAADTYFGVEPKDLTLAQCASIIAITNNPSIYDPLFKNVVSKEVGKDENGNPIYEDWTTVQHNKYRQELILGNMLKQGYITQAEYDAAVAEPLIFYGTEEYEALYGSSSGEDDTTLDSSSTWSYFTDMLFEDLVDALMEKYGYNEDTAVSLLYNAGYTIYATVDPRIQQIAEDVYGNVENLNYTSNGKQLQSGITVIDPYTGKVVATAGRIGEKPGKRTLSYATARRPCGSALKPISVYAPALENGVITPASVYDDYPVSLTSSGRTYPLNSPQKYRGLVTLNTAVRYSANTVAVRVLKDLGFATSYDFLVNTLGFGLVEADIAEAPLAMGGLTYGVTTVEMAAGFSIFPNDGIYNTPYTFTKVEDSNGNVILENGNESWKAVSEQTAYQMNQLLTSVVTSGTGTAARISNMTVAGKTGTTSDQYDRYFVGYTPYYCAAVWVGYGDNTTIRVSGSNPAAVLWQKVMARVHEGLENKSFNTPSTGLTKVTFCSQSGLLAGDSCTSTNTVYVTSGNEPKETCTQHTTVEICTESGKLCNEFCPPECRETRIVSTFPREVLLTGSTTVTDPVTGESYTTGTPVSAEDSGSVLISLEKAGTCTVHNILNGQDPNHPGDVIDPNNPDGVIDPNNPDGDTDSSLPGGNNGENAGGNTGETVPPDPETPVPPSEPETPGEPETPEEPGGGNSLSDWLNGLTGG